jgi:hypothetical protein
VFAAAFGAIVDLVGGVVDGVVECFARWSHDCF